MQFVEFDAIGSGWIPDEDMLDYTVALIEGGYTERILLSHDAGWYQPGNPDGQPEGGEMRGYTSLVNDFIQTMKDKGVPDVVVKTITHDNPVSAYGFSTQ